MRERKERKGAGDRVKTGADEDGEIETESNVELIGETWRASGAAAQQTETATSPRLLTGTHFLPNEVKLCAFQMLIIKFCFSFSQLCLELSASDLLKRLFITVNERVMIKVSPTVRVIVFPTFCLQVEK